MTKDCIPYLKLLTLKKLKPRIKKAILSDPQIINAISECVLNLVAGNIQLSSKQKKKLKKYKKDLRILATKTTSKLRKRKILQQKGGGAFLPFIIPAALSLYQLLSN